MAAAGQEQTVSAPFDGMFLDQFRNKFATFKTHGVEPNVVDGCFVNLFINIDLSQRMAFLRLALHTFRQQQQVLFWHEYKDQPPKIMYLCLCK